MTTRLIIVTALLLVLATPAAAQWVNPDTYGWLGMDAEAKQAAGRTKQLDLNAFEILR